MEFKVYDREEASKLHQYLNVQGIKNYIKVVKQSINFEMFIDYYVVIGESKKELL